MNKLLNCFIGLLISTSFLPLQAQKLVLNSSVTGVCYAGNKVNRIYIPPPDEYFKKDRSKSGGSVTIIYNSGFSAAAKPAMEMVASILELILPADTKLTVAANWVVISTSGVLANTSVTGYARGSEIDALNPLAYYPVALAEKIAGKSLNDPLMGDMNININSTMPWYLGTDGKTLVTKYDLVTVVLHEICHGLGFFDSMNTNESIGWYGLSSTQYNDTLPSNYDTFVENFEGKRLTAKSNFSNLSSILLTQLTGGQLYFNGPVLSRKFAGSRAKLWAPPVWDGGSSVSHLDEDFTMEPNTLMTPYIDKGEAIHNPGRLTMSILGDLGWLNTRIIHTHPIDTEDHLTEIVLEATIKSDTLYHRDKVGLVFSFNNFVSSETRFLTSPHSDDIFSTTINIPSYNSELQYYFFVRDTLSRLYKSPSLSVQNPYKLFIGTDIIKPVITHTPKKYYLETVDSISFIATAIDNLGIDTVYAEYKVNDGQSKYIGLKAGKSDSYSAFIKAKSLLLIGGDSIHYRIFAIDTAKVPNTAVLPISGYFATFIEDIKSTRESFSTTFTGASGHFFNTGFEILKPPGFSRYGLHTKHPYESPDINNDSINYTALLRSPLKFNESGMLITFNEIVLVEPGEPGSVYGTQAFYDYVVLEASKNFGKTWISLANGYDSRLFSPWLTAYNSSIIADNSTFVGTESMLQKHTIFYRPSAKISAGDTLLLRFRLFSDPAANGWGWVIEDLKINPLIDAVEKIPSKTVNIFPNPGSGHIKITTDIATTKNGKPLNYSVLNSAGICLINGHFLGDFETSIDISGYPSGIYIILLYRDDGITTIKYSLMK